MNRQKILTRDRNLPNMPKVSCRRMPAKDMQLRFVQPEQAGQPVKFSGYAVKWDSVNYYGEQFVKGAFADLINAFLADTKKVHMYYNHGWRYGDWSPAFAVRVGKWVVLKEDDIGLYVEGELTPGLSLAKDVGAMLEHGTIDGLSIAFYEPSPMDVEQLEDRILIKRVDIYEISPCDDPADNQARILNDDTINAVETDDEAAALLRSMGIFGSYADKLISRFKSLGSSNPTANPQPEPDPLAFLD